MNVNSTTTERTARAARAVTAVQAALQTRHAPAARRSPAARPAVSRQPVAIIETQDVLLPRVEGRAMRSVSGVSLRAYSGEISNVLGSDGAAKALLAVLAGQVAPAAGSFFLGGIELAQLSAVHRHHLLTFAMGTVLPEDSLPIAGTVLDAVVAPLLAQGLPMEMALARSRGMLDGLGLSRQSELLVSRLSSSQERLALFARAIAGGTAVLVCVQPEQGLAEDEARALRQALFTAAKDGGRCVLMSTSDERFASLADRTLWL